LSTTESPLRLQPQLDEITAGIPEPLGARIAAAVAEIESSGVARGLAVGDKAPNFTLPDALGRSVSLADELSTGPVVLAFYRGEWCPYCNLQLRGLQTALPRFRALGATLIAISAQSPDHSLSVSEKHDLEFAVLSDARQQVIRDYRLQFTVDGELRDLHLNVFQNDPREHNADGSLTLTVPATFVIDRTGMVRARFVSADWRVRMEPADIEAALQSLLRVERPTP
jgi:peroxiredoxin